MPTELRQRRSQNEATQLRWRRSSGLVGLLTIPVAVVALTVFVLVVEARINGGIDSIVLEQALLWLSLIGPLVGGGIAIVYGVKGRSSRGAALAACRTNTKSKI